MRWTTLACLGGGMLGFGSSVVYSSFSSDVDPPHRQCIDDDAGISHATSKDSGIGRGGDGAKIQVETTSALERDDENTFKRRGHVDGGRGHSDPSGVEATHSTLAVPSMNMCPISPGTGCSHFVSTAEWAWQAALPCALVMTLIHASDAEDDDDSRSDEDTGGGNDEDGEKDDDGDNLGGGSSTGPLLPVEHSMGNAYSWPRRSGILHEEQAFVEASQRIVRARYGKLSYHGQESASVPQPICLTVYILVLVIAAYRGNPRRGLRRLRRIQRRARSARYAKRRLDATPNKRGGIPGWMSFMRRCFSFFGHGGEEANQPLPDAVLLSENRLELNKNQAGGNHVSPADIIKIPSKETELPGTMDNVAMPSTLDSVASIPGDRNSGKGTIGSAAAIRGGGNSGKGTIASAVDTLDSCPKDIKHEKGLETARRAAVVAAATPTVVPVLVRIAARPDQTLESTLEVVGNTSLVPSALDVVGHSVPYIAKAMEFEFPAACTAALAGPNSAAGNVELLGTVPKVVSSNKKLQFTGRLTIASTSNLPSSVHADARPARAVHVSKVASSAPSVVDVMPASVSGARKQPTPKYPAIPAASLASQTSSTGNVESLGKVPKVVNENKKLDIAGRLAIPSSSNPPSSVETIARPAQAVQVSKVASSAPPIIDAILGSASCAGKQPTPKPPAIPPASLASQTSIAANVQSRGAVPKVVNSNKKLEIAGSATINLTSNLRSSDESNATPAEAERLFGHTSSAPSPIVAALNSAFLATKTSQLTTTTTMPVASASDRINARNIDIRGTCSKDTMKQKLETANRAAMSATITQTPSGQSPARPNREVQVSVATSSAPSSMNMVLDCTFCVAKAPSPNPAAITIAASASEEKPAGKFESLGVWAKVNGKTNQLETARRADTFATPTLPPSSLSPMGAVQASQVSGTRSSATSTSNVVLDDASCAAKAPSLNPAASPSDSTGNQEHTAGKIDSRRVRAKVTEQKQKQKLETTGSTINAPSTRHPSVRTPVKTAQAVQISGVVSSASAALDKRLTSASRAGTETIINPTVTPAAASATKQVPRGKVERHRTGSKVLPDKETPTTVSIAVISAAPTLPCSVLNPLRPVQAAKVSGARSSGPSTMNMVLDDASCAAKAPNLNPAAGASPSTGMKENTAGNVESLDVWAQVNGQKPKLETTSHTIKATPTCPPSVRTPTRPARAGKLSGIVSSVSSGIDAGSTSYSCAGQESRAKSAFISAAASASKEVTAASVQLYGTGAKGITDKRTLEIASRPAAAATPTVRPSVRTPSRPAQAVQRSAAASSTSSLIDDVLNSAPCSSKGINRKPAGEDTATMTSSTSSAGTVESLEAFSRVMEHQRKLEATIRAATAAPSIVPPSTAGVLKGPLADDVPQKAAQAPQLPRAASTPPEMDVALKTATGVTEEGPAIVPPNLKEVKKLLGSNKPAILGITRWFNGYSISIDPDGNCFGTSWLLTVLIWAAQRPSRLDLVISTLEDAGRPGQAFGGLDNTCKGYVEDLVKYIKTLKASWKDYPDYDTTRSAFLVVEVVKMFSGDEYVGCVGTEKTGGDPTWLKLKWGVAIASRTLDAWTAAKNGFQVDMDKLRELGESVILKFGALQGAEGDTPAADVLRPGGSMGLQAGMVVETYSLENGRRPEDYTRFLASATQTPSERTTTGLAVHQAGLPHFDILVTDDVDVLVFSTLGAYFGLPEPVGTDSVALTILQNRTTSQFVTTAEQLKGFVSKGQMKQQLQAMKEYEAQKAKTQQPSKAEEPVKKKAPDGQPRITEKTAVKSKNKTRRGKRGRKKKAR